MPSQPVPGSKDEFPQAIRQYIQVANRIATEALCELAALYALHVKHLGIADLDIDQTRWRSLRDVYPAQRKRKQRAGKTLTGKDYGKSGGGLILV